MGLQKYIAGCHYPKSKHIMDKVTPTKFGITETADLFRLCDAAYAWHKKAVLDNKFQVSDIFGLLTLLPIAQAAYDGRDAIPAELSDLDDHEVEELTKIVGPVARDPQLKLIAQGILNVFRGGAAILEGFGITTTTTHE